MSKSGKRVASTALLVGVLLAGCDVPADNEDAGELPPPATTAADSARAVEDVIVPDSTRPTELPAAGVADTGTSGRPEN